MLTVSPSEETLVASTVTNQLYCMTLSSADLGKVCEKFKGIWSDVVVIFFTSMDLTSIRHVLATMTRNMFVLGSLVKLVRFSHRSDQTVIELLAHLSLVSKDRTLQTYEKMSTGSLLKTKNLQHTILIFWEHSFSRDDAATTSCSRLPALWNCYGQ